MEKKWIKIGLLSTFALFLFIFAFSRSYNLIFGVNIKDVKMDGENIVNLAGNAKNAIHLTLNGREISINEAGDFNETIALLPGYNIVSIKAEDKFGNRDEEIYKLIR